MSYDEFEGDESIYEEEIELEEMGTAPIQSYVTSTAKPIERKLNLEEAGQCLNLLGKDESGLRYAYLKISANNMKLTDITVIPTFKHLLFVDVSNNQLKLENLQCLALLPFLLLLQCDHNLIADCQLDEMKYLQALTMNSNLITNPEGLCQPLLECLELQSNQIEDTSLFDTCILPKLRVLELKGNVIQTFYPIHIESIDSLYLAMNNIKQIEDLSYMVNLRVLHLRSNNISRIKGFTNKLVKLQYINLRNNNLDKFKRLSKLRCLPALDTLIVLDNPMMGTDEQTDDEKEEFEIDEKRIEILYYLPKLTRLNKDVVRAEEREAVKDMIEDKGEYIEEEESFEIENMEEELLDENNEEIQED